MRCAEFVFMLMVECTILKMRFNSEMGNLRVVTRLDADNATEIRTG